ncbi:MAG: hypothetical protein ACFFEY_15610 [Candidatus Thorarchaeota archaeon]
MKKGDIWKENMRNEIENRLHRVMIKADKKMILCPYSIDCLSAENCNRCNNFYQKCSLYTIFVKGNEQ